MVEQRKASPVESTAEVPQGTMLTVPAANPTGPSGVSPVVAVNKVSKWSDPTFLIASISSVILIFAPPIISALAIPGPFNWPLFIAGCLNALLAWSRTRSNSVTRS